MIERDELLRKFKNIQSQQVFYQTEIRRRDRDIEKLQEHLLMYKNTEDHTIEMSRTLCPPLIINKNNEDSLLITLVNGYENITQELKGKIKAYQDLYKNMQDEIEMVITLRKTEINPEIKKITSSLYNIPVDMSVKRIFDIFKENLGKLKDFMDETDVLRARSDDEGEAKNKVMEILENYTELVRKQTNTMKKSCSNTQKTLGDHEFENMWKIIASNKKILEENKKIIVIIVYIIE